ncbi:elongator complex protein 3 [Candidatus Omnitrophota bacterium]
MKIIPIFIPHAGCPYKCVYCDQHKISGTIRMPTVKEIHYIIKRNLKTIPKEEKKEIAFFGGTFTFLSESLQKMYLEAVFLYVKKRIIKGIRMSTHPEAVTLESMKRFKKYGGGLVELGIQSLDRGVLKRIKREIGFRQVETAVKIIKKAGLKLGVQMMLGLPGDTLQKSIKTAKALIKLNPGTVRIYPTLILKDTELGRYFKNKKYKPMSLEKAVEDSAIVSGIFENAGVKVIRIGLHPSEGLDSKNNILGGPYHRAFGEMVRSRRMRDKIISLIKDKYTLNRSHIEIYAPKNMFNLISGHKGFEKRFLEKYFNAPIIFKNGKKFSVKDVRKDIALVDSRIPKKAKEKLRKMNYCIKEIPFNKKLLSPIKGHADMMLFRYKNKIIYEPQLREVVNLLKNNGYECVKGNNIKSSIYPEDIIYNACAIGTKIIHYNGKIEKNIRRLRAKHILVSQGYAKCSIVPIDKKHIITSDKNIKREWERNNGKALLIRPGHIRLPGHKTGFIGGASGVTKKTVFFVGSLIKHPDGAMIRDFIRARKKGIVELYDGPLYDIGTLLILPCLSKNRVLY